MSTTEGAAKTINNGLVLYFDAGNLKSLISGDTTWYDLSVNKNTALLQNGATYISGNAGSVLFDGTDNLVTSSATGGILRTIEIWYNWDGSAPTTYAGLYYNLGTAGGRTLISVLGRYLTQNGNGSSWTSPAGTVVANRWNQFIYAYDSVNSVEKMYHNGVEVASQPRLFDGLTFSTNFRIGWGFINTSFYVFGGKISIFKVYDRTLSDAEILQNYNAIRPRYNF